MPTADTTNCKPIGDLVRKYLHGVSVDPFARNARLATHTNDLNPDTDAEHHMEAVEFLRMLADKGVEADCVIFDPPYSPRQVADCYQGIGMTPTKRDTQTARLKAECRTQIRRLVKNGGVVISMGWNTVGHGKEFTPVELLIVCHGGDHNDTLCMVERRSCEQYALAL